MKPTSRTALLSTIAVIIMLFPACGVISAVVPVLSGDGTFPAPGLRQGPFEFPRLSWAIDPAVVQDTGLPADARLSLYQIPWSGRTAWRVVYEPQPAVVAAIGDWGVVDRGSQYLGEMHSELAPVQALLVGTSHGRLLTAAITPESGTRILRIVLEQTNRRMEFVTDPCLDVVHNIANFKCDPATGTVLVALSVLAEPVTVTVDTSAGPSLTRLVPPTLLATRAAAP